MATAAPSVDDEPPLPPVYAADAPSDGTFTAKGKMKPLTVVDLTNYPHELTPAMFYAHFGKEPVIVRGLYQHTKCLQNLSRARVTEVLKDQKVWAWNRHTGEGSYVSGTAIFADLDLPRAQRTWNVVDHPVTDDTFGEPLDAPSFLRENWFLNSGVGTDYYKMSVTISAKSNWTALHTDNNGMQGWMWLAYGRKEWQLFSPDQAQLLYDPLFKEFQDERSSAAGAHGSSSMMMQMKMSATPCVRGDGTFPLAHLAQGVQGVQYQGDLVWFPPGWAHQVFTPEEGFGIGGAVINHYLARESITGVITDRNNCFTSALDVPKLFAAVSQQPDRMPATDPARSAARVRVDNALELFDRWCKRRSELAEQSSA